MEIQDGEREEILMYNDIVEHLRREMEHGDDIDNQYFRFKDITAHQGPLSPSDKGYKGSKYNALVQWETGETTYEPLYIIAADDPVTCTLYAQRNGLLDKPGWKCFE